MAFVETYIRQMDSSVAIGIDGMSCKLLKAACPALCPSLTYLINKSLFTSIVPQKWKTARVTPIFESGDHEELTLYRAHFSTTSHIKIS